ncbi:maternal protein exuperantia-like [Prorops nasuta]|uniref:maternal protein exuperantia-like n=1 Tax=Prorops nasuta TaxID=863751 RepID=UPI0034CD4128
MVSTTVKETESSAVKSETSKMGIPPGNYRLVGWDMDATGKQLTDEICQVAAYTPNSTYSQYVMPYKNLSTPAIKRHRIMIITSGKCRVLKASTTNKVIKTKSEISALMDFLTWLENIKGDEADGVILVYHEPRKVIPPMLLEALIKYNFLERFKKTVKGFVNGFNVATAKYTKVQTFSLRALSNALFEEKTSLDNAAHRARLAFQIIQRLAATDGKEETPKTVEGSSGEEVGSGDSDAVALKKTVEFIREYVQPIEIEENERSELKLIFERQSSLRPIFDTLIRRSRRERQHATPLRRLLAEAGINYIQLQEAWTEGKKEGIEKILKDKLSKPDEKKIEDLMMILVNHFDSEKKPKIKTEKDKNDNIKIKTEAEKENNNDIKCESGIDSPDTTTICIPLQASEFLENSDVKLKA